MLGSIMKKASGGSQHIDAVTGKTHYQRNKTSYIARSAFRKKMIVERVRALKNQPCKDCSGIFHPAAMDFDHRPGEEKLFGISCDFSSKGVGWAKIEAEIAKCDLFARIATELGRT
jgi:hypothetical protein